MTLRDYQEEQLFTLVRAAQNTQLGKQYQFTELQRYEDFREKLPLTLYKDIAPTVEKLKKGGTDLHWPGSIHDFAISAGTSGTGKHLPLSPQRLHSDKRFMRKITWSYLRQRPNIFKLWGKHISLPGSLQRQTGFCTGEISAYTARNVPWWLSPFQLISTEKLINLPFNKKVDQVIDKAISSDVRVITAVPSWLLTVFQRVLQMTGKNTIGEVWPNLQLLVCGGVKLANYRPHLEKLIQKPSVDFLETYGASEGYFAFRDQLEQNDMKLVFDNGIFYEFIPNPLPDPESIAIQHAIPVWEVEPDTPYAMVVSTNAGLWRYALNDIVAFTQTDPPRIEVIGRVSAMLDDYGEALYAYEAQQALEKATETMDIPTCTFTISATLDDRSPLPYHRWFIHTPSPLHRNTLDQLAQKVDDHLQSMNRHYAIRRQSEALGAPSMNTITQQQINNWLSHHNKQKAQGKLPTILPSAEDVRFFE